MIVRRESLEDSNNHERWLVSYADFITLLFGFFVVMYAISSVNEGKYRVLSTTLVAAFDHQPQSLEPIQVGEPLLAASPHVVDVPDETGYRDEEEGNTELRSPADAASEALAGFRGGEGVDVQMDNNWVEISLDASVVFDAGSARLSAAALRLVDDTAAYLARFDNPVTVEGYTDNVPPAGGRFSSNWELSAARAGAIAARFVSGGINRRRLAVVGYGDNHALATNATPDGRATNRRVVVVVSRQVDQARNLNAVGDAAFVVARQAGSEPESTVPQRRTATGGLLFSNEPDAREPALRNQAPDT